MELLVVITIVALLVALLLPAVQSAREAARRITCVNHLKQNTLAAIQYAGANEEQLPGAFYRHYHKNGKPVLFHSGDCDDWRPQNFGWRVALLPFLEEQNLFDEIDFDFGAMAEPNLRVVSQLLPIFQCPSTPGYPRHVKLPSIDSYRNLHPFRVTPNPDLFILPRDPVVRVGSYDYGIPRQFVWLSNGDKDEQAPAWNGIKRVNLHPLFERERDPCDLVTHFSSAKLRWVTDGLSRTTAFYEQAWRPNAIRRAGLGPFVDPAGEPMSGTKHIYDTGYSWAQPYGTEQTVSQGVNQTNGFGGRFSFHTGGVNNAMFDGAVRFLAEDIDKSILKALDSRAGGEVLDTSGNR